MTLNSGQADTISHRVVVQEYSFQPSNFTPCAAPNKVALTIVATNCRLLVWNVLEDDNIVISWYRCWHADVNVNSIQVMDGCRCSLVPLES